MKIKNLSKRKVFLIGFLFFALLLSFAIIYISKNRLSEKESEATEEFKEWNFVIINDTHKIDNNYWDKLFTALSKENPSLIIHLGDLGWNQNNNGITWGDYRYQLEKGFIDQQYRNLMSDKSVPFTEIHFIPGNHDIKKERTINPDSPYRENVYSLLPNTYDNFCKRTHAYWGNENEEYSKHFSKSIKDLGYENVDKKTDFEPFNWDVLSKSFCSKDSFSSVYSFERGGIRFVIYGYDISDNLYVESKFNELKKEVCESDSNLPVIILTHSGSEDLKTMEKLACPNKIVVGFAGHTHYYEKDLYNGIPLFSEIGILNTNNAADKGKDDTVIIARVKKNKIIFERWTNFNPQTSTPEKKENFFEVSGNFENYKNPYLTKNRYNFKKGAQLVNIPYLRADYLDAELKKTGIKYSIAFFDSGKWQIYSSNKLEEILGGQGFLVTTENDISIDLYGDVQEFSHDYLKKGWNLIGVKKQNSAKAFLEQESKDNLKIEIISEYKSSGFRNLIFKNGSFFGEDFVLDDKKSYFIFVR